MIRAVAWIAAGLIAALSVGCRSATPSVVTVTPPAGVTIALFRDGRQAYGVVDDRRWIEVGDGALVLDDVATTVPLASLSITALGAGGLVIGACARDRIERPVEDDAEDAEDEDDGASVTLAPIRCAVEGPAGRHLVRVVYVAPTLGYVAVHEVTVAGAQATVSTRYTVAAPRRAHPGDAASVVLYRGVPGGTRPRVVLAAGPLALDGTIATFETPSRTVPSRVVRVFGGPAGQGHREDDDDESEEGLATGGSAVWVWLELDGVRLSPGAIHALISTPAEDERHAEVDRWFQVDDTVRAPLWIDDDLRGTRRRAAARGRAERFVMSVANLGDTRREVWLEEPLRDGKRAEVRGGWPIEPELVGDVARVRVVAEPHGIARAAFELTY